MLHKSEIGRKLQTGLDLIFNEILKHELLFFFLFMIIPFVAYFIYLRFVKRKDDDFRLKPVDNVIKY
jgi:hypothetical protein